MATVPQSSWFCTLRLINTGGVSSTKVNPRSCTFKTVKVSSSSSNSESSPPNSSNSPENSLDAEPGETDPMKLAFAKAQAYKKSIQSNPTPKIAQNPVSESPELGNKNDGSASEVSKNGGNEEVPLSVRLAMDKPKEYKQNKEITVGSSGLAGKSEAFSGIKNDGSVSEVKNGGNQDVPVSVKLAMEKAKKYKKDKGSMGSDNGVEGSKTITGLKGGNRTNSENTLFGKMAGKKEELTVSSIDFMGLDFGEKKSRGLPAGLLPVADPFPHGNLPEVEILLGDSSRFGNAIRSNTKIEENKSDVYKPKVSTWGVFPRPSNISKTYGGGRVIRPGEVLETAEDKAAKEERTRELLAAYRRKTGLSIDPKLKSECERALKDGDSLMDLGDLKEALPFYEEVMDKLPFQSELHGLAALQWSMCQDSLSRPNEARVMYERLQSHPNVKVSKQAKQFLFSFQAMEMMKIRRTTRSPVNMGYQNYFEAFIEDKANYPLKDAEVEEGALSQALPHIIFLVSPIFIVLLIAVQKGM